MIHLGCMKLDAPFDLSCIRIGWHWTYLWDTDRALKILPNYSAVCVWLHCHPEETMLSPSQFWMDGWRVCLNFAMDFVDDFKVDDPLTFYYFLEGGFAVNIFRFGIHSWIFLFHWVWCAWIIFVIFVSPSLACLNYLEMIELSLVCLNSSGIVIILLYSELARLEFAVLVIFVFRLVSKLPCLFPFLFYFLVSFRFSQTPCRFFSCFVLSNSICWHLKLLARAWVSDVCSVSI